MLRRYIPLGLLAVIVISSFSLMLYASSGDSAVMDELAHIPAGYSYARLLDYRLNPEHPPLVKILSAIPLLAINPNFPTESPAWQKDVNGQWAVGSQFLYESGNNADQLIQWARLGPIIITLLLIIMIYIWSRELMGDVWALLPTSLFALSPTVLAHGHYVTTDVGAALGAFIALYYFTKFAVSPSRSRLFLAGMAFGIAQLLKFSNILLIPVLLLLLAIFYIASVARDFRSTLSGERFRRFGIRLFRYAKSLILVFIIGFLLVYPFYFLTTLHYPAEKQVADTKFTLNSFAGGPDDNFSSCGLKTGLARKPRCLAELDIWMAGNKILRPYSEYLLGLLMVVQRSSGGNTTYFLGQVSSSGWWYYFPIVFLIKETLPAVLLITLAALFGAARILKTLAKRKRGIWDYMNTNFPEISMIVFVIIYWIISIRSPLNIGVRHVLPTIPFIYILAAGSIKKWVKSRHYDEGAARGVLYFKYFLIAALFIWHFADAAVSAPYFLSFFNSLGGGDNGYVYVTDSNFDWGQDLKRLDEFVVRENIPKIAVDYFGGGSPLYYMGRRAEVWRSSMGNPKEQGIEWLAVSVNTLQQALGKLAPGAPREKADEYGWLQNPYRPFARAGKSIFIYKL